MKGPAKFTAWNEFRIYNLTSAGGGNCNEKIYFCNDCQSCFLSFRRIGRNSKYFRLQTEEQKVMRRNKGKINSKSYKKYRARSREVEDEAKLSHQETCLGNHRNVILDPYIVLNHPTFKKIYKNEFPDDPIMTTHNITKIKVKKLFVRFEAESGFIFRKYTETSKSYEEFSPSQLTSIVDCYNSYLYNKMIIEYLQLPLDLQRLIDQNSCNGLSILVQGDVLGRFLRMFVGLPISRYVGEVTLPILSTDGFHFRTPSFDGVMFCLCSKDAYGKGVLLSFAIIPKEIVRHLGWTVECNILNGLSFNVFPLFTDQGKLLAAALAFTMGEHNDSEAYRRWIILNLHICIEHYVRSTYHPFSDYLKDHESEVHTMIYAMANSIFLDQYFEKFFHHLENIFDSSFSRGSVDVSQLCQYGVFVLRVHPQHWTIFANCPSFDSDAYDRDRENAIHVLTFLKNLSENVCDLEKDLKEASIQLTYQSRSHCFHVIRYRVLVV